ncbi:glycoside hydrolase family 2 TIM barrel-domain containing protein, partial [Bacteroidota bacterium]
DNRRREDVPPDPGPFDYIKFSGLYRDVYLVETDPVHITFNWESMEAGVYITTPTVDPLNMNAVINVKTAVRNESEEQKEITVLTRLIDADGIVVLRLRQTHDIDPGRDYVFNQIGSIEDDLHLWDLENPYLYRVNSLVLDGERKADCIENKMGFRKVELNKHDGFLLNGKPVKMIGTNRHQHYGYIGDALPNSLHYKDVLQIKTLGMNIIRTAHYCQDDALMDACDELGVLVYEEAPTWIEMRVPDAWWNNLEQAARVMVRNHRNHPSIIIWGAGINHRGYVPRMHNAIKQEDPVRWTASQSSRWTGWQTSGLTDLFGQMMYGPGYWSEDEYILAMEGGRGARAVNAFLDNPLELGLITWSAHDYYTFHPSRNPNDRTRKAALMTVFREPHPFTLWYPAEYSKEPYLHIRDPWEEGIDRMYVYSNAEEVELLINGKSMGKSSPSGEESYKNLKHPPFIFEISGYEAGELTAKGYVGGELIAEAKVSTPGKPAGLVLELDTEGREFTADGSDILVAYARIVDNNGMVVRDAENEVVMSVKGPASVVGDNKGIGSNPPLVMLGTAPFLIQAGTSAGEIEITVKSKGLKSAKATLTSVPDNADRVSAVAEPIYNFDRLNVDLAGNSQFVQFDWIGWSAADNTSSVKDFEEFGGFSAEITAADQTLLRWIGEINVMGRFGFAKGDGLICMDDGGLILEFRGLKKGSYKLASYHHSPQNNTNSMDPNKEKEASAKIFSLPFTTSVNVTIEDAKGSKEVKAVPVTSGKAMHEEEFGSGSYTFTSNGT